MRDNLTRLNFGWLGYWVPDEKTIGTQPDQLEFVTSKAAAWDCPVSIHAYPANLARHPRTEDNFEVFRRWEEVRARKWLTEDQKKMLQDPDQEFMLLLNEKGDFELVACDQIEDVAGGSREVIAFTFRRNRDLYACYWHISGDRKLELPLRAADLTLMENLGSTIPVQAAENDAGTVLPAGKRRYIRVANLKLSDLQTAFRNARIVD